MQENNNTALTTPRNESAAALLPLVERYFIVSVLHRPLHELETLWLKDGIPVENTGINYNLNDPWNRTLSLVSANLTHTGRYTCQARLRSGGFNQVEASAHVTVLGTLKTFCLFNNLIISFFL
jgi:hypothetical protein